MAKFHLDRIKQKYGWTGGKYQALMGAILAEQSEAISKRVGAIKKGKLSVAAGKIGKYTKTPVSVPDISEVLPGRSVWVRKGAERGKLLTDSLRDQLTRGLRKAVLDFIMEGTPTMQYRKGWHAGRMNPELVVKFQQHVAKVFDAYAKRDPELGGVPRNVRTIADTEVRAVISEIKHGYVRALVARNPQVVMGVKTWIHHPNLSEVPRPGHARMNKRTVKLEEPFQVPVYIRDGTSTRGRPKWKATGEKVEMQHPHDPAAPISEVASCHCEVDYRWNVRVAK